MRHLLLCAVLVTSSGRAIADDDPPGSVRGLALAELADASELAQVDVATSVTSVGGVLGATSSIGVGVGRGFAVVASGAAREDNAARVMDRSVDLGAALAYSWGAQRISQVRLGVTQAIGSAEDLQVRGGAALRTTGAAWLALALELGWGERVDGTFAVAAGAGRGPIVPAVEAKAGRCKETCALGSAGVRVRLPAAFELGLAVIGEVLPARQVGIAISFHWTQRFFGED